MTDSRADAIDLRGSKLLLVEDDLALVSMFGLWLQLFGAQVYLAQSVSDAVAIMARHKPDVVVSDISMLDDNGHDLTRRIRSFKDPALRRTPAIALTARACELGAGAAQRAGFALHIEGPASVEAVAGGILRVLGSAAPRS